MFFSFSEMTRERRSGPRDLLEGLLEVDLGDDLAVPARGQDRGFVHDVREIRAGEARRDLGDAQQVDALVERLAADVHVEDPPAALDVGAIEDDLAVEGGRPPEAPGEGERP